jgi:excinuclease ABC subunit A
VAALRDHLFELRKKGFNRLFQAGKIFEFSTPESLLDVDFSRPVFLLVDRLAISGPKRTCTSAWSTPSRPAIAKPAK